MAAAGMADGAYELGALAVTVAGGCRPAHRFGHHCRQHGDDERHLSVRGAAQRLALDRAVLAAVRLTSANPAAALGPGSVGIAPGRVADLVALDDDLAVLGVLARRHWVDGPPAVSPADRLSALTG